MGLARRSVALSAIVLVTFLACETLASAQGPNKCLAKKNKCASKKMQALLKCHNTAEKSGSSVDPACLQKAKDKFDGGTNASKGCFAKLEAKNDGPCLTAGDTTPIENKVDAFVDDVVAELDPGFPTPVSNICSAGKKKCVLKKAAALMKCHEKAVKRGDPIDPACLQKAKDKFDGGTAAAKGCFAKLEAKPPCLTTGDTTGLEAKVDSFVTDILCELGYQTLACAPPLTPTPTPTKTATPTPTPTPTSIPACIGVTMQVTHIMFDHKGGDTNTSDGLNIRESFKNDLKHKGNGSGAGEWIRGNVRNERALYVANKAVTIKARLTVVPNTIASADIEALALGAKLRNVVKKNVAFAGGVSNPQYVEFSLDGNTSTTIEKIVDLWEWRASNIDGLGTPLCSIDTSGPHTVYTVLDVPTSPWYGAADQHPWVNALEFTIQTANTKGKQTIADAEARVASFVHNDHAIKYDTVSGRTRYLDLVAGNRIDDIHFQLTDFITAGPKTANCYDLASAVTSMSNLLGGSAEYHFMQPFGYIQATSLIGHGLSNNPFFSHPKITGGQLTGVDAVLLVRAPFGNHGFVQAPKVFDANVGPHLGTETVAQYITNSIDVSTAGEALKAGAAGNIRAAAAMKVK